MPLLYPIRGLGLQKLNRFASMMAFGLYGWDAGVIGGIIATKQFQNSIHYNANDTSNDNVQLDSFMPAGIFLGNIVGCWLCVPLVYRFGRRFCIIVACWVAVIGVTLQTSAFSALQVIIGRVVLGLGNGPISAIVPGYVQESGVSTPNSRSRDVLLAIGVGVWAIAASNWFDYGMFKAPNENAWRISVAMQCVFLFIAVIIYHGVMENPRWLYSKHRDAEGDLALSRLMDLPVDDPVFLNKKTEIVANVTLEEIEAHESISLNLLFRDKSETKVARRIWLSWCIQLSAPMYGGQVIVFYSASIFEAIGLEYDTVQLLTGALNSAAPVGMCFSYWLLPRFGRKPMMLWGAVGQLVMFTLFTILSNLGSKTTPATQWAAVAMLFTFQLINGVCWLWLPFLYATEVVPLKYRGQVNVIGMTFFYMYAFIEVYAVPIALRKGLTKIFIWFVFGHVWVILIVIFMAKETKGLSLEQIDLLWASDEYKAGNKEARIIEGCEVENVGKGGSLEGSREEEVGMEGGGGEKV